LLRASLKRKEKMRESSAVEQESGARALTEVA
jgi:hypothetical protein